MPPGRTRCRWNSDISVRSLGLLFRPSLNGAPAAQWNENGRMDGWTVTAECGRQAGPRPSAGRAAKSGHLPPAVRVVFNPLALHFAQPLPLPACPLVHLPGVGALCAWSEKSCLRLHFHINCPAALLPDAAPNLEWRLDGSTARRRRSLPAGAQPELLIQEFPEIKRCISLPRARVGR